MAERAGAAGPGPGRPEEREEWQRPQSQGSSRPGSRLSSCSAPGSRPVSRQRPASRSGMPAAKPSRRASGGEGPPPALGLDGMEPPAEATGGDVFLTELEEGDGVAEAAAETIEGTSVKKPAWLREEEHAHRQVEERRRGKKKKGRGVGTPDPTGGRQRHLSSREFCYATGFGNASKKHYLAASRNFFGGLEASPGDQQLKDGYKTQIAFMGSNRPFFSRQMMPRDDD